jgi:uncharacterized protein
MHAAPFAGHHFLALADRALFWTERRALLVADLHLEKASWYARGGQMLPPFDSRATLERLLVLAERCDAQEIWALGDSFHDDAGPERLDDGARAIVERLAHGRRIVWIAGNHDSSGHLPGERCDEAVFGDLVLRHEAVAGEQRFEISGHFHPKHRVQGMGRSVSRPCFAVGERRIIMPAFGALTGGLNILAPPLMRLLGSAPEAWIATNIGLHRYPLVSNRTGASPNRATSVTF